MSTAHPMFWNSGDIDKPEIGDDQVLVHVHAAGVNPGDWAIMSGVCSTRNVELVRSIGADHVIDYAREDFTKKDQRYDFILDNVANHSLSDLRGALTPTGTLVPNGGGFDNHWFANGGRVIGAHVLKRFVSHRLRPFLVSPNLEDLVALKELIEAGKVAPVIDRTYPLSEASQTIGHVGGGHAR